MSESPAVVYLEADDEITSVVRRVRATDAGRVIVVAPGWLAPARMPGARSRSSVMP